MTTIAVITMESAVSFEPARAEPKEPIDSTQPMHHPCDVLVVDDNPHVNKALAILLSKAGFNPIPCHRGADALAYAQQHQGLPPRAAVVDVHLPDISGLILAHKLRDRFGPTTPIIVVSGDTSMETINSLSHIGATCFFSKPINVAALVERLKELAC
jgi:DNA-binding response OmpR family regulator